MISAFKSYLLLLLVEFKALFLIAEQIEDIDYQVAKLHNIL